MDNPRVGWANTTNLASSWKALPHGWHFQLVVYPNGIRPGDRGFVSAAIRVRPPAQMRGKEWTFPELQQLRWFTNDDVKLAKTVTISRVLSNCRDAVHSLKLVSHATIVQKKWVIGGKFRICGRGGIPAEELLLPRFAPRPFLQGARVRHVPFSRRVETPP